MAIEELFFGDNMSTPSRIGIQEKDGTYTSIYCHWDGQLSCVGKNLEKYYKTEDQVRELLSYGSISSLRTTIQTTVFFYRDLKRNLDSPIKHSSLEDWAQNYWYEFNYFFQDGIWWVFEKEFLNTTLMPVKLALLFEKPVVR